MATLLAAITNFFSELHFSMYQNQFQPVVLSVATSLQG
jgi:hypothetical protein